MTNENIITYEKELGMELVRLLAQLDVLYRFLSPLFKDLTF